MKTSSTILPLLLLLCGGCLFEPYHPTAEFDLPRGAALNAPPSLYAFEFRNDSSASSRFQIRYADGRVVTDPYNRWVSSPGRLVARTLNLYFLSNEFSGAESVRGTLEVFEIEDSQRVFRLAGSYSFNSAATIRKRFDIAVPLEANTPDAIAAAAGAAVRKLAETIAESAPATNRAEEK